MVYYLVGTFVTVLAGMFGILWYINRLVSQRVEPLSLRIAALEHECAESDMRYSALQKLYENLQRRYDELMMRYEDLIKRYNLLQAWATGLHSILPQLKPDYPELPDCIDVQQETQTTMNGK